MMIDLKIVILVCAFLINIVISYEMYYIDQDDRTLMLINGSPDKKFMKSIDNAFSSVFGNVSLSNEMNPSIFYTAGGYITTYLQEYYNKPIPFNIVYILPNYHQSELYNIVESELKYFEGKPDKYKIFDLWITIFEDLNLPKGQGQEHNVVSTQDNSISLRIRIVSIIN